MNKIEPPSSPHHLVNVSRHVSTFIYFICCRIFNSTTQSALQLLQEKKRKKKEFRPCLAYVYKKHISEQPTEQDPKKETQVEQICGSESRSLILHYFLSAV